MRRFRKPKHLSIWCIFTGTASHRGIAEYTKLSKSHKHWIVAFSQHSNKQVKEGLPNHRASTSRSEGGACIKDFWGLCFRCDMWLL